VKASHYVSLTCGNFLAFIVYFCYPFTEICTLPPRTATLRATLFPNNSFLSAVLDIVRCIEVALSVGQVRLHVRLCHGMV
jgi:hypothetical protein